MRILVDRLWPRGVAKAQAAIDHWFRDLGPSTELRKWFGHDPARFGEFRRRYAAELKQQGDLLDELLRMASRGPLTLVYSAHDEQHNDAVVLKDVLFDRAAGAERDCHAPPRAQAAGRSRAPMASSGRRRKAESY